MTRECVWGNFLYAKLRGVQKSRQYEDNDNYFLHFGVITITILQ